MEETPEEEGVLEAKRRKRAKVKKKLIILSSVVCGGLAFLLWGMLKFPKKFGIKMIPVAKNCSEDMRICPNDWDLINNKCFFQSELEVTWVKGYKECKDIHASLAKLTSTIEMESLAYTMDVPFAWIGLRRNSDGVWRWADGSETDNWYTIVLDKGNCAYIHPQGLSSSSCDQEYTYICSKRSYCA